MADGYYTIIFMLETAPERLVTEVIDECKELDLYDKPSSRGMSPDEIRAEGAGGVQLDYDGIGFELAFHLEDGVGISWDGPWISFTIDAVLMDFVDEDRPDLEAFVERLIEATKRLAVVVDAAFVSSNPRAVSNEYILGVYPETQPIAEHISNLPWLGVYNPETVAALGGVDRFMDAPAHRVERLETGHVMVVATEDPFAVPDRDLEAYLLEGEDPIGLSDPFADLDAGEYGADVGVKPADISPDLSNEAYQLRRVRVDDDRNLRDAETNAFVRNVVDDGPEDRVAFIEQMLSVVPQEPDTDEHASMLLEDLIPPSFVRLDEPDDENIVTKVMDLDTGVDKHELLVSLGRATEAEDFTDDDIASIEGALDTLDELDGENVDTYIRQNLF